MYMCSFTRTAPVGIDQHPPSQRYALHAIYLPISVLKHYASAWPEFRGQNLHSILNV